MKFCLLEFIFESFYSIPQYGVPMLVETRILITYLAIESLVIRNLERHGHKMLMRKTAFGQAAMKTKTMERLMVN